MLHDLQWYNEEGKERHESSKKYSDVFKDFYYPLKSNIACSCLKAEFAIIDFTQRWGTFPYTFTYMYDITQQTVSSDYLNYANVHKALYLTCNEKVELMLLQKHTRERRELYSTCCYTNATWEKPCWL